MTCAAKCAPTACIFAVFAAGFAAVPASAQVEPGSLTVTHNAALATRIGPLLPGTTTLPAAAAGFRSDGEFIATLHAAHNLSIPFDRLKARTTGRDALSLGAAIQTLRPDPEGTSVRESVALAQRESERDIRQAASCATLDRVASRVASDDRLAARLNPLVPSGETLSEAAAGFRNEDQFLATLHAADDNTIDFGELKDRVTAGQSLAAAIHDLKPALNAGASASAAARARAESSNDRAAASASPAAGLGKTGEQ